MNIFEAIILGAVQGATEFLPISSSGHLLIVPALMKLDEPNLNAIAIAHLGTLLAVLIYFRRDLWQIILAVFRGLKQRRLLASPDARLGWYIVSGTIPALVAGLLLVDLIKERLSSATTAAFLLIVTGIILILGERAYSGRKALEGMNWSDAIFIGLAQAVALLPGISRSGITISTGLSRGLDRPAAARYSFLLGVPAIAGAGLLALIDLVQSPDLTSQAGGLLITFVTAALVGFACIYFLLTWLRQHNLYIFAIYCLVAGVAFLLIDWLR